MAGNPLGIEHRIPTEYAPNVLFGIARSSAREQAGLSGEFPFSGVDIWNCYELSWLEPDGRPVTCCAEIRYDCHSPNIVESKSLKLYLFSLNMMTFSSAAEVEALVVKDLSRVLQTDQVSVSLQQDPLPVSNTSSAQCIDSAPFLGLKQDIDQSLLQVEEGSPVSEVLECRIFRSLCPVTAQPDWATVTVTYRGQQIEQSGLLAYLASYRNHQGFHEECCERIFTDVSRACQPEELTVCCGFVRRGGLDINPVRTSLTQADHGYSRNSRQ